MSEQQTNEKQKDETKTRIELVECPMTGTLYEMEIVDND